MIAEAVRSPLGLLWTTDGEDTGIGIPEKALMVEDQALTRSPITTLLTHRNFEVSGTSDGPEALRLLAADTFDLVVPEELDELLKMYLYA